MRRRCRLPGEAATRCAPTAVSASLWSVAAATCGAGAAAAQTATGGKIDPTWLRTDAASKTVDFKLVAGLTNNNGGMNFNGFGRGGLVLTVPQGWTVALHFKNEDPNLPHSVEVIPEAAAIPTGPVPPAFEHATTGRLEQGFSTGQGAEIRFAATKAGSFLNLLRRARSWRRGDVDQARGFRSDRYARACRCGAVTRTLSRCERGMAHPRRPSGLGT